MGNNPEFYKLKGSITMFETFKENVKEVKDGIKDYFVELKDDTVEYFDNHSELIPYIVGGIWVTALTGVLIGVNLANNSIVSIRKDGIEITGDNIRFKRKLTLDEWIDYLEFMGSKRGNGKKKNRLNYLKTKGFID
jgi:hypothetical protein